MIGNIGYPSINQQQYGDHYPLVFPSSDIQGLIADMSVIYDDIYHSTIAPFRITDIDLDNAYIRIVDSSSDNRVVFDSSCITFYSQADTNPPVYDRVLAYSYGIERLDAPSNFYRAFTELESHYLAETLSHISGVFSHKDYGDIIYDDVKRYTIYYWSTVFCTVKLVVRNQFRYKLPLIDIDEQLDPRACTILPEHVRTINGVSEQHVVLKAGYNISLTEDNNAITIGAVPGAGLGKVKTECSNENKGIVYSVNGVEPINGNIILTQINDGYTDSLGVSDITWANSNTACCKAVDCEAVGDELDNLSDSYYAVGAKAEYTRDAYAALLQSYNNLAACTETIRLDAREVYCPYIELLVQFSNTYDQCVTDVQINLTFSTPIAVVRGHGMRIVPSVRNNAIYMLSESYTPTLSPDNISINWTNTTIAAGDTVFAQWRVYLTNPNMSGSNALTTSVQSYAITLGDGTVINSNLRIAPVTSTITCPAEVIDNSISFNAEGCAEEDSYAGSL